MRPLLTGTLLGLALCVAPPPGARAGVFASELDKCSQPAASNIAHCDAAITSGRLPPQKLAAAYNFRGQHWQVDGEMDRAIADYTEAVRLDPKYFRAYYNRANCFTANGDADKTIADLDTVLQLDPKVQYAYTNRGLAWLGKGEYERAMADFRAGLALDPADDLDYWATAMAHYAQGRFEAAAADMDIAWEKRPKNGAMSAIYAIWGYIAHARAGPREAAAAALLAQVPYVEMNRWPAILIKVLQGTQGAETAYKAADEGHVMPRQRIQMLCTTATVIGEWYLVNGQAAEARSNLERARDSCAAMFNMRTIVFEDMQRTDR